MVYLADVVTSFDVFGNPFRHDVAGSFESVFGGLDAFFLVDIFLGETFHVVAVLRHNHLGERLETFLTCYLSSRLAFWLIWKIKVFNVLQSLGVLDAVL